MYLYNGNFIVTYLYKTKKKFKYISEQKILKDLHLKKLVEDLRRNVLSKNIFSLSLLPFI